MPTTGRIHCGSQPRCSIHQPGRLRSLTAKRWTSGTAQVGRRSSADDVNQLSAGEAISLARIPVTVAAGLVTAVTTAHAVATNTSGSVSAPASSLGRLISRTRPVETRQPVLGRNQRHDPDPSTNTIRVFRKYRRLAAYRCRRNPVPARFAVPMSNMPMKRTKAVRSRSRFN